MTVSAFDPRACDDGRWAAFLDAMPEGVLCADVGGRVIVASVRLRDWFGLEPASMVGRAIGEFEDALRESFAESLTYDEVIGHPLEDRAASFLRDVEVRKPERRVLQVQSVPVGERARLWIMRDVTGERDITELKIRYGGMRSAEELKSEFVTVASHRLRTPLNAVRWNIELLLGGEGGVLQARGASILRDAYDNVATSIGIVDDLVVAAEIDQRSLHLEKTPFDAADLVERAARGAETYAKVKGVRIRFVRPEKPLPPLFGDESRLARVFDRVIDNAVRYTAGTGTEVRVEIVQDDATVSVRVTDQGVGIPEKEHARVFQRFYRSRRAVQLHPDASGLGLYIAKYIVEAHDGAISFASAEGKGTTFTITLPKRPSS